VAKSPYDLESVSAHHQRSRKAPAMDGESRMTRSATLWKVAFCAFVALWGSLARAQVVIRQDFEGPEVSWRDGRGNPSYRIEAHQRTGDRTHSGSGCEFLQFVAGANGTFVYMIHYLAPARLIPELQPTLWVRSDRPGIQLRARVVFPRSADPKTGEPATALIAGTSYSKAQSWEQLRFVDIPRLAADQARVLRAELKRDVDTREAYIDRLILNIYTGPGRTRLWIDDLEIAGFVGDERRAGTPPPSASGVGLRTPIIEREPGGNTLPTPRRDGPRLNGSLLLIGDRPFFPRVIEHQGETLAFLRQRGFNCVRTRITATPELLNEAANAGIWLICPPPMPKGLDGRGEVIPLAAIAPEFDSVLAWDLGEGLTGRELDAVKKWAEQVRRADPKARPILCGASAELRAYSSKADVLLIDRFTIATTFELIDYRRWLQERPRLARPGTPIWTTVSTEPAASLVNQVRTLSGGRSVSLMAGTEHTRLLTYTALGAGARGLFFASHAPLDADDNDTRWRAAQLELLNLELDLIEPWAASGTPISSVSSNDPDILAAVLQGGGAHVLLPVWSGKGAQYVPGQAANGTTLSFVVPGVSETVRAYEIIPGGLRPIKTARVAGGISVTLDDFGITTMVILTQNLSSELTRRAIAAGERAAQLHVAMSGIKLQVAGDVQNRVRNDMRAMARAADVLKTARDEQTAAENALQSNLGNRYTEAIRHSQFADRNVRLIERGQWLAAIGRMPSTTTDPLAVSFATLPQHFALAQNIATARRAENLLPEGDCEDLGRMINAGWKHYQHPPEGIRAGVQWSEAKKFSGRYSLRLAAAATDPATAPAQIETPPVWITTPPIPMEPGTLVRLHGRVLVPAPIVGSPDGLLILDSLGGEVLAERVTPAADWKEWNAYRMVDDSGTATITFALSGLGEVWIDDISIEPLIAATPAGGAPANSAPANSAPAAQPPDDVVTRPVGAGLRIR